MIEVVNRESLAVLTIDEAKSRMPGWAPPDPPTPESLEGTPFALFDYEPKPTADAIPGEVREEEGLFVRGWREAELTEEETTKRYERAIQARLDAAAISSGYDSISTAISYAEEPAVPKFQNDGKAFRTWRSLVWAYAYEQLAAVKAGEREQPTVDEFLQELPVLELST